MAVSWLNSDLFSTLQYLNLFFFFFKRKHVHTDLLKKFRLKETVFEKLEPFSWIPYVFFGRRVLSAWPGLMLGILNWWNTGLLIPFSKVVFRYQLSEPLSDTCHCFRWYWITANTGWQKMCHQKPFCCRTKLEMAESFFESFTSCVMWKCVFKASCCTTSLRYYGTAAR